jgi:hypothetical protein
VKLRTQHLFPHGVCLAGELAPNYGATNVQFGSGIALGDDLVFVAATAALGSAYGFIRVIAGRRAVDRRSRATRLDPLVALRE